MVASLLKILTGSEVTAECHFIDRRGAEDPRKKNMKLSSTPMLYTF